MMETAHVVTRDRWMVQVVLFGIQVPSWSTVPGADLWVTARTSVDFMGCFVVPRGFYGKSKRKIRAVDPLYIPKNRVVKLHGIGGLAIPCFRR